MNSSRFCPHDRRVGGKGEFKVREPNRDDNGTGGDEVLQKGLKRDPHQRVEPPVQVGSWNRELGLAAMNKWQGPCSKHFCDQSSVGDGTRYRSGMIAG